MHLADLNWMDIERYLEQDDRIILITGATEQHGYLSLLTDIKIPQALAAAAAEREGVLVAPPLNFGCSQDFMEFPGTISLSEDTFNRVLGEIVRSLLQHGFSRFLVLNGHGGNQMPAELETLQRETDGLRIIWYNWWQESAALRVASEVGQEPDHANWLENFPFTRVGDVPAGEKPVPDFDLWQGGASARDVLGDGSFGGPYQVSDAVMERLFNALVEEAAEQLHKL